MSHQNTKLPIAVAILALWVSVIVGGFWWYEMRLIRPFLNNVALFDGQQLKATYATHDNTITLMHFVDPNCPCNKFNLPHLKQLQDHYQKLGIRFVLWQQGNQPFQLTGFDERHQRSQLPYVPATPAVAIWSSTGELSYFGPYSTGLLCSLGEGFAETILDQLEQGLSPEVINTTGVGCFCPTQPIYT
jgi:Domain of unknown function (DUF6436)